LGAPNRPPISISCPESKGGPAFIQTRSALLSEKEVRPEHFRARYYKRSSAFFQKSIKPNLFRKHYFLMSCEPIRAGVISMLKPDLAKWNQSLDDLFRLTLGAAHQDMDAGSGWHFKGKVWCVHSTTPGLHAKINGYGAYDGCAKK